MRRKLYHPLWVHIPALALVAVVVVAVVRAMPLPETAPVHFGISGRPDRYGSPWEVFGVVVGLSLLYILISAVIDELWARQEERKTFNWLSLFDELTVGVLGGIALDYLRMLGAGDFLFRFPWASVLMLTLPAVLAAVALEHLRPYRPYERRITVEDTSDLEAEVARQMNAGQPIAYSESQNPAYVTVLVVVTSLAFVVGAVATWPALPPLSIVMFALVPLMWTIYGGMRVLVTNERLTVRLGFLGIRLLSARTSDIADVEARTFQPLQEFGGWGIRWNGRMWGFYWRGNRGVVITTTGGKKYLIGSDHPDRLAAVIRGVTGI